MCNSRSALRKSFYIMLILMITEGIYLFHTYLISVPSSSNLLLGQRNKTFEKYSIFDFDRANWTVYLKYRFDAQKYFHPVLEELIQAKMVKHIVHPNGTLENLGCKNTTSMCGDGQHYNPTYRIRINTPPCCLKGLLITLKHLCKEYDRLGVSYLLAFGGVIGWVRYQQIIPYESDLDLIVDKRFWNTPLMEKLMKRIRDLYGHVLMLTENGNKIKVHFSKTNSLRVDVWPYEEKIIRGDRMVDIPHSAWKYQPSDNIFPLKRVLFSGIPVYVPANPVEYLNTQYGKGNWEQEISCQITINGKCQFSKSVLYTLFGLHWFV